MPRERKPRNVDRISTDRRGRRVMFEFESELYTGTICAENRWAAIVLSADQQTMFDVPKDQLQFVKEAAA